MSKNQKNQAGFSLIELIVSTAILVIMFMLLMPVFSNQNAASGRAEITTKAIFLANELMTRVISKAYDENQTPPWTPPGSLGLDPDDRFDDVDDFAEYNNTIPGFPGYVEQAQVFYVSPAGSLDDIVYTQTEIKKIIVTITHNEIPPIVLETIVSSHY